MAAHATTISIEEYLQDTSYSPDVEYIDGELKERPVEASAWTAPGPALPLVWVS